MNFSLMTTFAMSQMFLYVVLSFISIYLLISLFISSLTQLFFSSVLFNLHVFVVLPDYIYLCPFSLFFSEPGQKFVNFINLLKEPDLRCIYFFYLFFVFNFIYLCSNFDYFFPSADFRPHLFFLF